MGRDVPGYTEMGRARTHWNRAYAYLDETGREDGTRRDETGRKRDETGRGFMGQDGARRGRDRALQTSPGHGCGDAL